MTQGHGASGTLFVLATPLGNLADLSPRALEVLRSVACIACEDTRRTARLLARFEVTTSMLSCHRFNERERLDPLLARLRGGDDIALLSDGGTPLIADPGALLVEEALKANIPVSPIPGPCAVTTLLSVSGIPGDRYVFDGFLPHRAGERRRRLRELAAETRTVVLFETPHRIRQTLADMDALLGDRLLVLGRELTKQHETLLRGPARDVLARLDPEVRGEITLVMAGAAAKAATGADAVAAPGPAGSAADLAVVETYRAALTASGGDRRAALRQAARVLGMKRPALYRYLAELGEPGDRPDGTGGED